MVSYGNNFKQIDFDSNKDIVNIAKHGISLRDAVLLDWGTALIRPDERKDYGEPRQVALALLELRMYHVAFVMRGDVLRVISLRKANDREKKDYERTYRNKR